MENNVQPTGPEREPEPTSWADATAVVHYNPDRLDELLAPCGISLVELRYGQASTDPALVTCPPCAATLVDGQLAEPEQPAEPEQDWYFTFGADHTHPATGERLGRAYVVVNGTCDSTREAMFASPFGNRWSHQYDSPERAGVERFALRQVEMPDPAAPERTDWAHMPDDELEGRLRGSLQAAAEFPELAPPPIGPVEPPVERRTVSVEVLTDEVRAASIDVLYGGKVGIVCRADSAVIDVPELDTLWEAPYRKPADILSILLRQARHYADEGGAELLMPGADVLAALSGQPVGAYTARLLLRADQVARGWIVCDWASEGDELLVLAVEDCRDATCPWTGSGGCRVVATAAEPVHLAPYHDVTVRIPAAVAR
jgi:hypothetical protein